MKNKIPIVIHSRSQNRDLKATYKQWPLSIPPKELRALVRMGSIFIFLFIFISDAIPDTIHLKNGRSVEGLIKKETQEDVWLDLGIGAVKFRREEIDKIDRSSPEETDRIHQEWQKEKALAEKEAGSKEKEIGPKEVGFSNVGNHIFVNVLLNNKVNATLILDTGAHSVFLSDRITKELGIKTQGLKIGTIAVGGKPDLRVVDTVLNSIKVGDVEAKDVDVELALEEAPSFIKDGLLGMGFLKKFKFQIDNVNKKLILEEKKSQNILKKTKYFSAVIPSDWETWIDEESMRIDGPNLNVKGVFVKPSIMIKKITDEQDIGYFETAEKTYDYFKNSPDIKHKMSEWLKKSFEKSYPQDGYEQVSFDFEEKKDLIMLHMIYINKTNSALAKRYDVDVITTDEPLMIHSLSFVCPEQYFEKYLPIFKRCVESFNIN